MSHKKTVAGSAADPTTRFAKLTLDGETYKLAFDFNSLALAESMTGLNLLQALRSISDLSVAQLRGLLYAAMLKAHPRTSVLEAGRLLNLRTITPITEAIGEALALSLPEQSDERNPPEPGLEPAD